MGHLDGAISWLADNPELLVLMAVLLIVAMIGLDRRRPNV